MNDAGVIPRNMHQQWQFAVEISGFNSAFFTRASFPKVKVDVKEFHPAGSVFPEKRAGRVSFDTVTLEKGVSASNPDEDILIWLKLCITSMVVNGMVPTDYMRDVDLVRYDRTGREVQRVRLYNAFVADADLGEGDGGSSEPTIEKLTLAYQFFDTLATDTVGAALEVGANLGVMRALGVF